MQFTSSDLPAREDACFVTSFGSGSAAGSAPCGWPKSWPGPPNMNGEPASPGLDGSGSLRSGFDASLTAEDGPRNPNRFEPLTVVDVSLLLLLDESWVAVVSGANLTFFSAPVLAASLQGCCFRIDPASEICFWKVLLEILELGNVGLSGLPAGVVDWPVAGVVVVALAGANSLVVAGCENMEKGEGVAAV